MSTIIEQDQSRQIKYLRAELKDTEARHKERTEVYNWLLLIVGMFMYMVGKL